MPDHLIDPLEGLDQVAWSQLHHAYGPAADVPDQLRALRSPDVGTRRQARQQLTGNIYHQGTRWQASGYAVPFLVALVDDQTTPDRVMVAAALRAGAAGARTDRDL